MFPIINMKETGVNLRRIMDRCRITPKDIKKYLNLSSVQSVYNWLNGINMPTIDNLYALSQLFQVPIDALICGNRETYTRNSIAVTQSVRNRRLYAYYKMIYKTVAA